MAVSVAAAVVFVGLAVLIALQASPADGSAVARQGGVASISELPAVRDASRPAPRIRSAPPAATATTARLAAREKAEAGDKLEKSHDDDDSAEISPSAPAFLRRTLYQTALMQWQRGDRSGALDSAGKIADSLASEGEGGQLSDAVADVRSRGGGAANADFDSLMELIRETIAPDTWDDVGGPGSMEPFGLGVYVDVDGVLRRRVTEGGNDGARLEELQRELADRSELGSVVFKPRKSPGADRGLRMVSLVRLEQAARHFYEAGLPLPDEVRYLGGIGRVQYVMADPERNDLIIAGPPLGAEDARPDELAALRRATGDDAGRPALQLDDLVVLLRSCRPGGGESFGCTIVPRPESLARVKAIQGGSSTAASTRGGRERWVQRVRDALGEQDVQIWGVPADSRVGSIMVTADYRMKLIGFELEQTAVDIPSYFELLESHAHGPLPPMETLRWWFTPHYDAIVASPDGLAYELRGDGVQLLSENQKLLASGQRVPTGRAEPINELFAKTFTQLYPDLAAHDPLFAELRNVFDLAVVAALITKHDLAEKVGWSMDYFGSDDGYEVGRFDVPKSVESVVNYRELPRRRVVTAVSGGVQLNPWALVSGDREPLPQDSALRDLSRSAGQAAVRDHWWWQPKEAGGE